MPAGKTHDKITILTAAATLPVWYILTAGRDPVAYLVGLAAYLFSGIWLSDDLDTNSTAYKRWGALRFLWWPYRILIPHRSWLSHGIAIGPLLRALYFILVTWAALRGVLLLVDFFLFPVDAHGVMGSIGRALHGFLAAHRRWQWWVIGGLILGGVTHSAVDSFVTRTKRLW